MVYVHVHYELGLHMITFLPQQPHIYDLNSGKPFFLDDKDFNASGASNMLTVEHVSSFIVAAFSSISAA